MFSRLAVLKVPPVAPTLGLMVAARADNVAISKPALRVILRA
jgi:hypothetical protein